MKNLTEIKAETKNTKHMEDFYNRWDVSNNFNYDIFKTRCLDIIKKEINDECEAIRSRFGNSSAILDDFCAEISFVLGIEHKSNSFYSFESKSLYKYLYGLDLKKSDDYIQFLYFLEIIMNIEHELIYSKKIVLDLAEALKLSNANLKIINDGNEYYIISKNIDFLDKPLIIDNLKWLNDYEDVKLHFLKSLRFERKKTLFRNIVDELRLSLELFFDKLFDNEKTLENQKNNIGNYLKENNVSSAISNMYVKILDLYAKYNNDNAKHGDKVAEVEIDFLTYLTGTFMRLVLQIEEEKKTIDKK